MVVGDFLFLLLPFTSSYLVSNSFSKRCQELPLVALPPLEKVVFNRHGLSAAVRASKTTIW
jgi:hypothetical protein